jgi:hypothetical protein
VRQVLRGRVDLGTERRGGGRAGLDNQSIRRCADSADIAALAVFLAGPHGRSI